MAGPTHGDEADTMSASSIDPPEGEFRRGWTVVLASAFGLGLGVTGLPFYSMGQFLRPLTAQFGWSREDVSIAVLCLSFGPVVTVPLIGRLVDKIGARTVALTSMPAAAAVLLVLASNRGSIIGYLFEWVAFSLLASGTSSVVWTRAVNTWFTGRRGLALGLTTSGTGVSAVAAPIVIGGIIHGWGWRWGYVAQAAGILCIALSLACCFFRERVLEAPKPDARRAASPGDNDLRQALGGAAFWRLGLGMFMNALVISGLIVHMVPMLEDRGVSALYATSAMSLLGVTIIIGRLAVGFLLDRIRPGPICYVTLLMPAAASAVLLLSGSPFLAVALLGLAVGADVDLLPFLASRRFGMIHYAEIFGCLISAVSLGGGLGPFVMGLAYDRSGSYAVALFVAMILSGCGAWAVGGLASADPAGRIAISPGRALGLH